MFSLNPQTYDTLWERVDLIFLLIFITNISTFTAVLCVCIAVFSTCNNMLIQQYSISCLQIIYAKPKPLSATRYEGTQNNKYFFTIHHCALPGPGPALSSSSSSLIWSGQVSVTLPSSKESWKQAEVRVGVRRSAPAFPTPQALHLILHIQQTEFT